ncbi:unnamed protein product [Mytilus coruscus]|uniref:TRIM71 n=1 Tax=Mytilus coruscus TaxID=42192 RepID=A0A6J8EZ53_MYTCO|nr:unnamed protein product [Mytilus coruscus]
MRNLLQICQKEIYIKIKLSLRLDNVSDQTTNRYNDKTVGEKSFSISGDNKVLVGGVNKDFPEQGRRVVILMNQNGDHERAYEHDQHKQPIFTLHRSITHTSNGNIHVVDVVSDYRRRVLVLGQGGDKINIYTGDKEINKDRQFYPTDIVTTPRDNVIVADMFTDTLHILNNAGLLMTYYKTSDINIVFPCSLSFTPTGQLYIGCNTPWTPLGRDTEINKDRPFYPTDIVTTHRDNVIVADMFTDTLHILNNAGLLMTYYKTSDINIMLPYSLAFSPTGTLYIGCTRTKGNTTNENKIYEVTISRC